MQSHKTFIFGRLGHQSGGSTVLKETLHNGSISMNTFLTVSEDWK